MNTRFILNAAVCLAVGALLATTSGCATGPLHDAKMVCQKEVVKNYHSAAAIFFVPVSTYGHDAKRQPYFNCMARYGFRPVGKCDEGHAGLCQYTNQN